jgi:hypothetical protein
MKTGKINYAGSFAIRRTCLPEILEPIADGGVQQQQLVQLVVREVVRKSFEGGKTQRHIFVGRRCETGQKHSAREQTAAEK